VTENARPLKLVIAGGGTGGHVLPAVAVVEEIRRRGIPLDAHWIGGHTGVEREIARDQGIPFTAIQTGKLRRYLAVQTFTDALRIPVGVAQAWTAIRRLKPHVIYSTGGAVSVPTVISGNRVAPVLTHEQTAQIGIANKTASRFAKAFAVGFEETAMAARQRHDNVVITGNPVRASLNTGSAAAGRERFGFTSELPVIYVTGGARGASPLNQRIEGALPRLLERAQVIHQVGPASANHDFARLTAYRNSLDPVLAVRYVVVEFVGKELADIYAMSDLVVGRAGAGTVSELGYVGLPSILIPLPGTWGDEQRKNARILGNAGAAVVLEQSETTSESLGNEIIALAGDPERRQAMAQAARGTSRPDAASRLVDELLRLAGRAG
jgi:UDP-N-acetylglucosamine--N-acetylmuramyl-(pentapeptide) pyrophosphoryl-undecaprenol N-acetylglucosamine transferase